MVVKNRAGIHARPASQIVQLAAGFSSNIFLQKDSERVNAKSIMGIIALGVTYNSEITISAEGPDEEEAAGAIEQLFERKFQDGPQDGSQSG